MKTLTCPNCGHKKFRVVANDYHMCLRCMAVSKIKVADNPEDSRLEKITDTEVEAIPEDTLDILCAMKLMHIVNKCPGFDVGEKLRAFLACCDCSEADKLEMEKMMNDVVKFLESERLN